MIQWDSYVVGNIVIQCRTAMRQERYDTVGQLCGRKHHGAVWNNNEAENIL